MPTYYTYKYRIYPNKEQEGKLNRTFGCCRFLFNQMLDDKINHYKLFGEVKEYPTSVYKEEYHFLYEADALALHRAKAELDHSFKALVKQDRFPNYKRKKSKQTFLCPNASNRIKLTDGNRYIELPSIGPVRIKAHRPIPQGCALISVTVIKLPSGRFYAALLLSEPSGIQPYIPIIPDTTIGLDYSAPHFYVDSTGAKADPPHFYRDQQKHLKRAYKKLRRMQKTSRNYEKERKKVARLHERIANQRRDFLHKESHRIANEWDSVCVESLNMRDMGRHLNLGKSTKDNAFGMFRTMLQYKLECQGKHLLYCNAWIKTSQLCHVCGYVKKDMQLSTREWTCPNCHTHHDRDINAAINIKDQVLKHF